MKFQEKKKCMHKTTHINLVEYMYIQIPSIVTHRAIKSCNGKG